MKTILYDRHCALGAKIVSFAGWEMPVYYQGILTEHHNVRQKLGLFDVSHMGRIQIEGSDAEVLLNYLSTNQISGKKEGSATYTVWCDEEGGCVDDVIVYKQSSKTFFVIVNASNRQKDLTHILKYSQGFNATIQPLYEENGILALQGPLAESLLSYFILEVQSIKPMHFLSYFEKGEEVIISRTGYTGETGFEIYASNEHIVRWWDKLLLEGKQYGIAPIGLGARDTLRLEMGYALYGHELTDKIFPNESVAAWTIKWDKKAFIGKNILQKLESSPQKRHAYGMKLMTKGIAREGCLIYKEDICIGTVTSGTFSPSLNQGVALILVDSVLSLGEMIKVQIREEKYLAQIVSLPFIERNKK